jgi:hypothetical protein
MASQHPGDDELARLLAQARWPVPRGQEVARLADHWRRLRAKRRRDRALAGLAAAAGILLVVGIAAWRTMITPETAVSLENRDIPAPRRLQATAPEPKRPSTIVPRDPSVYEQVLLLRAFPKRSAQGPGTSGVQTKFVDLDELITRLAKDPQAQVDDELARLQHGAARVEPRLWKAAREGEAEKRLGAARLLARLGTSRSAPVLVELAADPAMHEAAVAGLARVGTNRDVARLAATEPDTALRRQLLAALVSRGTSDAVALYLGFVSAPGSRTDALTALTGAEHLPADVLLTYLESPQGATRLAAALALSRISDPAVVERLCDFVWGIGRQEALVALLLSQTEQAAGCVNHARTNLYLVASLRAAERRLDSLQIPRGGLP